MIFSPCLTTASCLLYDSPQPWQCLLLQFPIPFTLLKGTWWSLVQAVSQWVHESHSCL